MEDPKERCRGIYLNAEQAEMNVDLGWVKASVKLSAEASSPTILCSHINCYIIYLKSIKLKIIIYYITTPTFLLFCIS